MAYNPQPPYEILQTKLIEFRHDAKLRRFARHWTSWATAATSIENQPVAVERGWSEGPAAAHSPFSNFLRWSEWLHERAGRGDGIALVR